MNSKYIILAFIIIAILAVIMLFLHSQKSLDNTKRAIKKRRIEKWVNRHNKPEEEILIAEQQEHDLSTEVVHDRIVEMPEIQGEWTEKYLSEKWDLLMELFSVNKKGGGYWVNYVTAQNNLYKKGKGRNQGRN